MNHQSHLCGASDEAELVLLGTKERCVGTRNSPPEKGVLLA